MATAFGYAFFWTAATAIYLLLRYDVDQSETDEVFVEEEEEYDVPTAASDTETDSPA